MRMYWGTLGFDANSVRPESSIVLIKNKANVPYLARFTVRVMGYLAAVGQANLMALESTMLTAMQVPYKDLLFYDDSGALTSPTISMRNALSVSGVTIIDGPNFPSKVAAEYATQREFNFTAQGDFPLSGSASLLVDFNENLSFSGGQPKFVCRPCLDGPSVRYKTFALMPYVVVQQGSAVGFLNYPFGSALKGAPPLFPAFLRGGSDGYQVTPGAPERSGTTYQNYPISWRYVFESPTPLIGVPNFWPLTR